jgi:DNA-binding NarL/FixJ family response regulator
VADHGRRVGRRDRHRRIHRTLNPNQEIPMPRVLDGHLSPGQLAALRLAANGFTSRQIAVYLGSTETGIHVRLKTAAASLGARSRSHAVAIALVRGLIKPDEIAAREAA